MAALHQRLKDIEVTSADVDAEAGAGGAFGTGAEPIAPTDFTDEPKHAPGVPGVPGAIRSGKLAGRTLTSAIWVLALPVLLQQTMQACVQLFDKIFAGRLPEEIVVPALDGLGIGSYIGWFMNIAMAGLGIGGQAVIARAIGRGSLHESDRALGQSVALSVIWGALVGVVLWFAAPLFASLAQLTPEATAYCMQYVRIMAISMPAAAVMMVGAMCLYGAGETTWPAVIAIVINVINIIASWALSGVDLTFGEFTLINPFSFDLHVIGIAAGSAISFVVGAILTVMVLARGVKDLRLRKSELRLEQVMIWRIIRIGVPNFFEGISMWGVNLFVLIVIGMIARRDMQEGLQGAHVIAVQWEAFSFMPGFAIGTAAGALAGQYLGAGNPQMARKTILVCTGLAMIVMGLMGVLFIFAGDFLTHIVSDKPVHMENTPKLLLICGLAQIFFAVMMVMRQGLRGVGDTKWTFLITTVSSYGVRLPLAWLLGYVMGLGLAGVWIGLCSELAVRAALFSARFFHGGWKRLEV